MKLNYELNRSDLLAFQISIFRKSRLMMSVLIFIALGYTLPAAIYWMKWFSDRDPGTFKTARENTVGLMSGVVFFAFLFFGLVLFVRHAFKKMKAQDGHRLAVELTKETCELSSVLWKSTIAWPRFTGFLETSKHFFLYLGPGMGQIIPKRVLTNDSDLATVRALIAREVERRKQVRPK